uniref:Uncharacterized protein n=1 Tax=Cryptomonas curvata TaxID=233186 RepID=A0A7S0M5H9_9CRYP
MEPFVGPAAPFVPEGDGYDDVDLLSPSREQQGKKKPAVVRKHNEAIQSQLREGAFLGTLHLPVDYGGFQKTISETNFRIKERYNKNLKELTRIVADFDAEVVRFAKENKDPKSSFKETADRYRLLQLGPTSCIKIDGKRELRVLFPRFGKPRPRALAEKKDTGKDAEPAMRGVITLDRDEKDKVMWAYEGRWHTAEDLRKVEKKDLPHDVWASMEDLEKGVVYEQDRGFWTEVREMLMRTLTPGIVGIRDEQKKKNRAKLFRERLWRLFQDLLEDARQVAINEIRLQEKRVECNGGSTVLQTLLEEGAVVNAPNRDGFTPLMIAARNGRADTLRALLETPGVDLHATNEHGSNAMHYAAMYAHKECVLILREREREVRAGGGGGLKGKLYEARNCLDKTPYDLAMDEEKDFMEHKDTVWKQKVVKEAMYKVVPEFNPAQRKPGALPPMELPGMLYREVFRIENPEDVRPPTKEYKPTRSGAAGAWRISRIPDPACRSDDLEERDFARRWKETYKKCKPKPPKTGT